MPPPTNLASPSSALPAATEGQRDLQFSAVSRHFEAAERRLCVDGIVAVDPERERKDARGYLEAQPRPGRPGYTVLDAGCCPKNDFPPKSQ